jgi:hypothetical protein
MAQRQQGLSPSRLARDHALGRPPRIQRAALNRDAVGVDELSAGQQCGSVDVRCDLHNGHGETVMAS